MQVGRFIAALEKNVRITLVTTPIVKGWQWEDQSLLLERPGVDIITAKLPFHSLSHRILSNHRLSFLQNPDSEFWLPWLARRVLCNLSELPDVIYSRSGSFSAALLAYRLKSFTGLPWMMHLSDPWAGSPYRQRSRWRSALDKAFEEKCFLEADLIALTTQGQADFYKARYPEHSRKINVSPNMMPSVKFSPRPKMRTGPLRIVYTGALYGDRNPSTLLHALEILHRKYEGDMKEQICVDFYGNMSLEMARRIREAPGCFVHGPIPFEEVAEKQANADILLTIEPDGEHPLLLHFMPSKNLDYIASGKPILAITPRGSETHRLCQAGHGWAFDPSDPNLLAVKLMGLMRDRGEESFSLEGSKEAYETHSARNVTREISNRLEVISGSSGIKGNQI
ncbi:hypothetical protein BMI90_11525 [Thioclava sp. L04-15]|nr:hypothetical protein BMI90_11525 [Thioclava sp. L04-15]